jgi:hypothetical protein
MAGSITVSSITLDSDNNFSIKSNTGATLFFANTTGIDIANSIGATAITNDKILSVANTKITGNIISSQIASDPTFYGNVSVTGAIGVGGATPTSNGSGITFPATQSASSDANTLDDYEEGTWTPVQGGGLTVVGAFSSSGRYTKIGRSVSISGRISGATSIATTAGTIMMTGLPFTVVEAAAIGTFSGSALTALAGLGAFTTTAYSTTTMGTTLNFDFSCTYTVA